MAAMSLGAGSPPVSLGSWKAGSLVRSHWGFSWVAVERRYTTFVMARALPLPPPGFDELSMDEKLDYVQSLWDRIAAQPPEVPVPDWHREVLEERLEAYRANPNEGRPWEEVRNELQDKLQRRRQTR